MKAPKQLTFEVTQDHIDRGKRGSAVSCPIALAIKEKYGDDPSVGSGSVIIHFEDGRMKFKNSKRMYEFIKTFDGGGGEVQPAKFRTTRTGRTQITYW